MDEPVNPSDGKFDPPPGEDRFRAPAPSGPSRWILLPLIAFAVPIAISFLEHSLRHSSSAYVGLVLLITVPLFEHWLRHRAKDAKRQPVDPHSPAPNVPR